jgi:acyl carrier protein
MNNDNKNEKSRLLDCFAAVFPSLSREQIERAEQANLPEWDSIATVTLITVIEDEFHVEIPATEIENLVSFDNVLKFVASAAANPASK